MKKLLALMLMVAMMLAFGIVSSATEAQGTTQASAGIATVNGTSYNSLAEAISSAKDGETIVLNANVSLSERVVIDKSIILDGNSYTLTSTADRAINVACNGSVTIKNLTINTASERAINVITSPAVLTIENVNATAGNYAVNVASSAGAAKVTIKNSNLTGLNVINIAGAGSEIVVSDTKLTCVDNAEGENYAALMLNKSAVGASIVATNITFDIKGDSVKASNGAENATITINDSSADVKQAVAYISYGDYGYSFATIEEALELAKEGETITLLCDVKVNASIVVNKNITIDLGGKTITSSSQKAFEIYSSATIKNGTIKALQRCVDTRKAVELTLNDVTLIADNYTSAYSNPQPLTIGGFEHGTVVNMTNVNISAKQGYGIITFVQTELTAINSSVDAYGALYVKTDSANSTFNFINTSLTSDILSGDTAGNSFGAIVISANGVSVHLDSTSRVEAKGNNSYAIGLGTKASSDQEIVKNVDIEIKGTIVGNVIDSDSMETNSVVVPSSYASAIKEGGYNVSINADNDSCAIIDWKLSDIFDFAGYSTRENGTGFTVGYSFNASAYNAYCQRSGKSVEFGTHFAVNGMSAIEDSLVDYAKNAGVFNVVVCGLNESHSELNLEMTLYFFDGEEKKYINYENGTVSYDSTVKNLWNVGEYMLGVNA